MTRTTERSVTFALLSAIAIFVIIIAKRQWPSDSNLDLNDLSSADKSTVSRLSQPVFVDDWQSIVQNGTQFGGTAAPIQVIEFADLQCPACKEMQQSLSNLKEEFGDKLALTFVHFPLPYHQQAIPGARAAECVKNLGNVERFVDLAYKQQKLLGKIPWQDFAQKSGVHDLEKFSSCMEDTLPVRAVKAGLESGKTADVTGTPTIIINGWKFQRPPSEDLMRQLIRSLLAGKYSKGPPTFAAVSHPDYLENEVRVFAFDTADFSLVPQFGLAGQRVTVIDTTSAADSTFDPSMVDGGTFMHDKMLILYASVGMKVLAFDSLGRPVRSLVRAGAGPGELHRLSNVARVRGDTVALADYANRRISWYTVTGGFRRSLSVASSATNAEYIAGALPNGHIVLHTGGTMPTVASEAAVHHLSPLVTVDENGAEQVIAKLQDMIVQGVPAKFPNQRPVRLPLPLRMGPRSFVAVWDSLIATGNGNAYQVDLRNETGSVVAAIKVNRGKRPVTSQIRTADLTLRLEELNRNGKASDESLRLRREWPVADSVAHFGGFFVTPNQTLWVLDALVPGLDTWYATSFSKSGQMTGRLSHTGPGVPIAFGDDRVAVRSVDAEGVVSVIIYRLVPRAFGKPILN